MMRQTKKLEELHKNALKQFDDIYDVVQEEREQCVEDRRFCTIQGAQWEGPLSEQYANKPKFEVNKVHLSVIRIINEYRNNRITVNFTARKPQDDRLSELSNGLYLADLQDSDAQEAFDNAFEEACQGGFGAYRLRAEYEDEYDDENEAQRIRFEPIFDADSTVFFDPDSKRKDKSDAKYCFVLNSMTPDAFRDAYGDDPDSWDKDEMGYNYDWNRPDVVYVAEYYKVEEEAEWLVTFEDVMGKEERHWESELEEQDIIDMESIGTVEVSRRKIKQRKIHKYLLSGGSVLEDCGCIAGRELPIIPVYGKRWMIDGIERCMGHVRLSKDAQRLKNMQLSKLGEMAALSSMEKPILTPEQIAGHQVMWSEDNIKDYPYLLINPMTDAEGNNINSGPVSYTKPASIPPSMAALLQITEEDMKDILGRPENGEQIQSHLSGKAVELIQMRLDMQTYIYMSNYADARKRDGKVWISMAKDLYIEDDREMKVVSPEGGAKMKKIMVTRVGEAGGVEVSSIDKSDFDVNVDVGPSSNSMRENIVMQATNMLQYTQDPVTQQILSNFAMMNMEGDGISTLREHFRKNLVKMQVLPPTEDDMEEMQLNPEQPSPQDQYALAEAQRAEGEAAKYRADTVQTIADAELKKAQAQKILFEMQQEGQPSPEAPEAKDWKEDELYLEAQKTVRELEIKEREVALKEQEMELRRREFALREQEQVAKLAEIGSRINGDFEENHSTATGVAEDVEDSVEDVQGE